MTAIAERKPPVAPKYQWMHPSCRDLVIDCLITNPGRRRRFLRECGPSGIMLAMSVAGGNEGRRTLPLLVDAADWTVLGENLGKTLKSADEKLSRRIFDGLQEMIEHLNSDTERRPDAESLIRNSLLVCQHHWNIAGSPIEVGLLLTYCQLSESTYPFVPLPNMIPTLAAAWEHAKTEFEQLGTAHPDEYEVADTKYWLLCAITAAEYDPRALRRQGFPREHLVLFEKFVRLTEEMPSARFLDPDSYREDEEFDAHEAASYCEEESSRRDEIASVLRLTGKLFPSLLDDCTSLAKRLKDEATELERNRKAYRTWNEPDDGSGIRPAMEGDAIDSIMNDL